MQLTPHLASLVLLFSALVAAAPAAMPEPALDIRAESIAAVPTAGSIFESREATCNAPRPKDAAKLREYNAKMSEMAAATVKAHQGEQKCKSGEFISSKNKQVKERVKNNCVAGYTQCVSERKKANAACKAAGGVIDQGHKDAVSFCQSKLQEWKNKRIV